MTNVATIRVAKPLAVEVGHRTKALSLLRAAMEGVVLALVGVPPWCYGAVHPAFEFLLFAGTSLVLALWAAAMLLEGRLTWKKCPVTVCLAGLILLGAWQITPLPKALLASLSPATARLYDQLYPAQPEVLTGNAEEAPRSSGGHTLSLYPTATRAQLARLLMVFLLFAAVRNNFATAGALWRLSLVALLNGAALSLFALAQFFSSAPNVLYWTYPSMGHVFGPFICKNHFPFYLNVCIGLGVGLLLSRAARPLGAGSARGGHRAFYSDGPEAAGLAGLLRDPAGLWVSGALTLMLVAVGFSLSRGGVLALAGGALICLLLRRAQRTQSARRGAFLLTAALAVLLGSWLGFGLVAERLATLWKEEAFQDRLPIWSRMAPAAWQSPLWGTGLGTFATVERLTQQKAEDAAMLLQHAHNEYLEMLIEGGLPGLCLTLLALGFVFRLGYRGLRLAGDGGEAGLALGALFGFSTVVIHSFGDFGTHIPAITVLATVVAAQLSGLGASSGPRVREKGFPKDPWSQDEYSFRLGGLAPLLGAGLCLAFGFFLVATAWRDHRVDCLRTAALQASGPDWEASRIACLERAVRLAPDDAGLRSELGRAHLKVFDLEAKAEEQRGQAVAATEAVLAARGDWPAAVTYPLADVTQRWRLLLGKKRLQREHLGPALRNYVLARDRCPLLGEPHLILATYGRRLARADAPEAYLDRLKRVANGDPEAWYLSGAQELLGDDPARAWASWRRSLELSDRYFPQILGAAATFLAPHEVVESVLPDRPELLLAAAQRLYPDAGAASQRRPFLEKAARLLEGSSNGLTPEGLHTLAVTRKQMGQPQEAVAAYRKLLVQRPRQADWRYELAQILYEQGELEEARRELVLALTQQPKHAQARELLTLVSREITRSR
jgi:O-antigen ligase/tetratricopeptide (TPR) repeat protein